MAISTFVSTSYGGEGGIRTKHDPVDSVTCRIHNADVARNAMAAVAPCMLSHADALAASRASAVAYALLASFMVRRRTIAALRSKLACMCIQNCGVVLKSCARRSAVSADTP